MKITRVEYEATEDYDEYDDEEEPEDKDEDENEYEDEFNGELYCPICGEVWYEASDGYACFKEPCKHLKFVWEERMEIKYYNNTSPEKLEDAAKAAYKAVHNTDYDGDDILEDIHYEFDVWGKMQCEEVDELLDHTQEFMTCGMSSYTVLFGIKHDSVESVIKPEPVKSSIKLPDVKVVYGDGLTDTDGNTYRTVIIGKQEWTVENWKSTKYADGTPIPNVTKNEEWKKLETPAYCWYENDPDKGYGALYNWWVVDPANEKKVAPEGWRVPTDEDWEALGEYLIANGYNWDGTKEGNKIGKAVASNGGEWSVSDNAGYVGSDQDSNNRSGFSALPSSFRFSDGGFGAVGSNVGWWSTTETTVSGAKKCWLVFLFERLDFGSRGSKGEGYSVRLLRDINQTK